jgi:hypothetical protein
VQQLRGTRKGGGVFDAVAKARAIYEVVIIGLFIFYLSKKRIKKGHFLVGISTA